MLTELWLEVRGQIGFPFWMCYDSKRPQKQCLSEVVFLKVLDHSLSGIALRRNKAMKNYTIPDAVVKFAKQNDISVRGHKIFWENPNFQTLGKIPLCYGVKESSSSKNKFYVNENLHFSFFEEKLGKNASQIFYSSAYHLDPRTTMVMNQYNTIEYSGDEAASPVKYIEKLEETKSYPGNASMLARIGLQSHFGSGQPNIAYMRVALDILGATGLPIWLAEVDVQKDPNQKLLK
ncbi:hypothetical protein RJ640_017280 [Escallonia rubra]|uniref:GH10 domain-containing protein n=1 Tax=Escallonia rubra TaxID=112253 RepID=A0AA88QU00_9ASTE|nr:hypothetical protein RJ640_017280 [Escallonia rubra]